MRWRGISAILARLNRQRKGLGSRMFKVRRRRDLVRELASLRRELGELKVGLAEQVTTRRLVVVDGDGVQRVVVRADQTTGSVLVRVDAAAGETTGVELFAVEPVNDVGTAEAGVALYQAGEVAGSWPAG
ncbi:hypothetical protein BN381_70057 [Candidatus Microthrix parvicella RN1]|uniref:Uncharacterized protein n=2 Tax=Candidatus Neomicrothrix TaxID=41949 RepID=R4Z3S2_9ACTN|nr:hypothetical protein BN381_70057 [Candidatus Microthrix parvicella RN1]